MGRNPRATVAGTAGPRMPRAPFRALVVGRGLVAAVPALLAAAPVWAQAPASPDGASHATVAACTLAPGPDTLWSLAQCCAKDLTSNPGCLYYSKANEFVVVKDHAAAKPVAYLIIPSVKVTGVEDNQVFAEPVVDFWQYGWQEAQHYLQKPSAGLGLAINSAPGRDQDQLHIHISCVLPAVAQTLAQNDAKIGSDPAKAVTLPLGPHNNAYKVVKVTALGDKNSPFNLIAAIPHAKDHMGDQSIAVIGSKTAGVYYVLDTYYVKGANRGSAEELLDQACQG